MNLKHHKYRNYDKEDQLEFECTKPWFRIQLNNHVFNIKFTKRDLENMLNYLNAFIETRNMEKKEKKSELEPVITRLGTRPL
jgi:hypothetical protein